MDRYFLKNYNGNDFRIYCIRGGKNENNEKIKTFFEKNNCEESQRVSLSRTKRNIKELALSNPFDHFATITVSSENADRFSLSECQTLLKKKFKALKRKNKDFIYLFITEKHENGAFHFHGLVGGINDYYINKNGYLSHSHFDSIGFNSFSKIKDFTKCCNYITKYITKDCIRNESGMIYISSRGLKKAEKSEILSFPFQDYLKTWENDYCKIADFRLSDLDLKTKLDFFQKIIDK